MKRARLSLGAVGVVTSLGILTVAVAIGACGDDRDGFTPTQKGFDTEGGTPDAETCSFQCSLDGRSVIQSCTGEVIETCAEHLACGEARCQEPCAAAAADRSSNGCEFYVSMPRFKVDVGPQGCHAAFVVNASNQPATLSLEFRGKQLDLSRALFRAVPNSAELELLEGRPIAPGESAILFVSDRDQTKPRNVAEMRFYVGCPSTVTPAVEEDFGAFKSTLGQAFHLTSNVPVGLTSMYPYGGAASYIPTATLVFPVSAWGKEHIVVDGWETNIGEPTTQIYASEDDTEVTLIGTKDIANGVGFTGAAAKTPMTIRLAKGQFAQIVQSEELTGSFVFSSKPTITVGGNSCAFLPGNGDGACDTLAQQIPPYEQWGSEYVGVGYRPRTADADESVWYRMVAARNGTELDYGPVKPAGAPLSMSAGEMVLFQAHASEPFVVRSRDAEHPFYLGMHMVGHPSGAGDPEFVNVVPTGQFMNSYSFYADSTYSEHSLVIVRQRARGGQFEDVWLECAGNLPEFHPVDGGQYEYTRVDLSRHFGPGDKFGDKQCTTGLQRMRSKGPFSATLWGWGAYASYAYPGGLAIRKLVKTPLSDLR